MTSHPTAYGPRSHVYLQGQAVHVINVLSRITYALRRLYTRAAWYSQQILTSTTHLSKSFFTIVRGAAAVLPQLYRSKLSEWLQENSSIRAFHSSLLPRMRRGGPTIAYSLLAQRSSAHGLNFSDHRTLQCSPNEAARIYNDVLSFWSHNAAAMQLQLPLRTILFVD